MRVGIILFAEYWLDRCQKKNSKKQKRINLQKMRPSDFLTKTFKIQYLKLGPDIYLFKL